ncbi:RNA polymerase sigma (SigX) subunit [Tumebacillus sp. BK434]|uniref:RNA polymerase sigma factor n=1 Tax=Tumebacillus sp. BK434 TaxID=2512169 RepID=UPI001042D6B7|nr:RNA polymerase sigma factor [Tumebacillus sp. BK434]TCP55526.1 RNA polymerase sigma (SigX) subunit [Tumebacillus sp. BK434]
MEEEIQEIYRLHFEDVYHFLLYFTGDVNDAEDLTQEVFLRLLKSLQTFDHRSTLKTWILSVAKHVALDHYRKKRLTSWFPDLLLHRLQAQDGLPEELLSTKEERRELMQAITRLKPAYRSVIILRAIKELSIKETAEILGCKESKVKVDYHRALKLLQQTLSTTPEGGLHCVPE